MKHASNFTPEMGEATIFPQTLKNKFGGAIDLVRPRHMIKNLIIFGPLLVAGNIHELTQVILAFAAFSLMAMAVYALNDTCDAKKDSLHPKKRFRPIPSGRISQNEAIGLSLLFCIASLLIAFSISSAAFIIIGAYALINVFYSFVGKSIPVIDLILVASGFMLRGVLGIDVLELPSFLYFFTIPFGFAMVAMAAGKRVAKLQNSGKGQLSHSISDFYDELRLTWIMIVSVLMSITLTSVFVATSYSRLLEAIPLSGSLFAIMSLVIIVVFTQYIVQTIFSKDEPAEFFLKDRLWIVSAAALLVLVVLERFGV